ncbi:MAG: DUF1731 domain-containing protein, partial [Planctomycetales bacterium]|nr:DUF1731 domain-containing protein [Planctomycetales bacterium]
EVLTEDSPAGTGFLPEVAQGWEAAAEPLAEIGVRTAALRFGVILSRRGGALAKMLTPFRMCVGGVVGSGRQYWSWVSIDDVARAVLHTLSTPQLSGPVNVVSPQPVTNREFTKALGRALYRPTIFPLPAFVARIVLGEMADALLLASARVLPKRLKESGFEFSHPDLDGALASLL